MKRDSLGGPTASEQNLLSKAVTYARRDGLVASVVRSLTYARSFAQERKNHRTRRSIDKQFDSETGLDTGGYFELQDSNTIAPAGSATAYQAIYPKPFCQAMDLLPIRFQESDFIDFGSGKGRAVFLASKYPFKQIIGVEFSKDLHAIAERNLQIARAKIDKPERIRFLCEDAAKAAIPPNPLLVFFYNSFGDDVMARVSENLQRSFKIAPRDIWVVYFWPLYARAWETAAYEEIAIEQPEWPTRAATKVVRVWRLKGP